MHVPIVNDEIRWRELVRVEQERRDTERKNRHPEVGHPSGPDRQCNIEQHDQRTHAEVDTRSSEPGVEDTEGQSSRSETTSSGDVTRTTECQVREDRVRVDLGGEDFEDRRE